MIFYIWAFKCFAVVKGIVYNEIPETGVCPDRMTKTSSVFYTKKNQIITFGGRIASTEKYSSSLYSYSVSSNRWNEIHPRSGIKPPAMYDTKLFIQSSRYLILLFGVNRNEISSEVYKFDLELLVWSTTLLTGDQLYGLDNSATCSFTYNNIDYFAIYGGLSIEGISNSLFIIEVETLKVSKLITTGETPAGQLGASLSYDSEALYLFALNSKSTENILYKFTIKTKTWKILSKPSLTHQLNFHTSYISNGFLFIFFSIDNYSLRPYPLIHSYSLLNNYWSFFNISSNFRVSYSSVQINDHAYFLFGQTSKGIENSVIRVTLDLSLSVETLIKSAEFPKKRKNHASFVFDSELYIFGGVSDSGDYLNDMWSFNFQNNVWNKINPTGNIPTGRELMNIALIEGLGIVLTSGKTDVEVFNEFYYFEMKNKYFNLVQKTSNWKSPRYSSCLLYFNSLNFEIGGRDMNSAVGDLFIFDYMYNNATLISMPDYFRPINHHCFVTTSNLDSVVITVVGGTSIEEVPNYIVYDLNISGINTRKFSVSVEKKMISNYFRTSDTAYSFNDGKIFLVGGSLWSEYLNTELVMFDSMTNKFSSAMLSEELHLFGHSVVQYRKDLYIFGGARGLSGVKTFESYSNSLYKITFDNQSEFNISCSKGTVGDECLPCGIGTYNYGKKCIPCPKGTFSNVTGAYYYLECISCEYGTYTDKEGSTYCKLCPENDYCPVRATSPSIRVTNYKESSNQPQNLVVRSSHIEYLQENMWYIFLISALVLSFVLSCSESLRNLLKSMDLLVTSHGQKIGSPVIYRRTRLGGLFFLFFMIIAILTFAVALLIYLELNISESKSLVPLVTLDDQVESENVEVQFTLLDYPGNCSLKSKCADSISVNHSEFSYSSKSINCEISDQNCKVTVDFKKVLFEEDSEIQLNLNDLTASASGILLKLSSSSSIPKELSESFVPVFPSKKSSLFRGQVPTVAKFEFIPSVIFIQLFYSESSNWPSFSSGYHVRYTSQITLGTTVDQKTCFSCRFYLNSFLYVKLEISLSNTALITKRTLNNNWITFFGALLGTIFGLLESVGSLMGLFEGFVDKIESKINQNQKMKEIFGQRRKILLLFNVIWKNQKKKVKGFKVLNFTDF